MTTTALNSALRDEVLKAMIEFIATKFDADALSVSSSAVTFPVVDAEGNEKFAKISVSIPRGSRNGAGGYDEYDGYTAAEDYRLEQEEKAAKREASKAKKEAERKLKEERKAAKKVLENAISES